MFYILLAALLFTIPITYKIAKRQEKVDFLIAGIFIVITTILFFFLNSLTDKSPIKVLGWSLVAGMLITSMLARCLERGSFIVFVFIFVFCMSGGGIGLSVISAKGWILVGKDIPTFFSGEPYEAEVYDYNSEIRKVQTKYHSYNDIFYYPCVSFTTKEGAVVTYEIREPSSFVPEIGKKYTLYYDAGNGSIFEFRSPNFFMNILATGGALALLFLAVGAALFAFRCDMSKYFKVLAYAGYAFLFGFIIMVASLLIDMMLDPYPIWLKIILGLSASMLLFLIVVWIRYLRKKRIKQQGKS